VKEQNRAEDRDRAETKRTETDGKGGREKRQERAKERSSRTERNRAELSSGASGMEQHREKDQNRGEERDQHREMEAGKNGRYLEEEISWNRPSK